MRKGWIVAAGLGMLLLVGCSDKENSTTKEDANRNATADMQTTQEITDKTIEDATQEATKAETDRTADNREAVSVKKNYYSYNAKDHYDVFNGYMEFLEVYDETHATLAKAMEEDFKARREVFNTSCKEMLDLALSASAGGEMSEYESYFNNVQVDVMRDDNKLLSVRRTENSFQGGVHGSMFIEGVTYDVATGRAVWLTELGVSKDEMIKKLIAYFQETGMEGELFDDYQETIMGLVNDDMLQWYLNGRGVVAVFNQYDIAPYAAGYFEITIPYNQLSSFNKAYIPTGNVYTEIPVNRQVSMDVTGDGKEEDILVEFIPDEENNDEMIPVLTLNGQRLSYDDCYCFDGRAYYTETVDGGHFIIIESTYLNYYTTLSFTDVSSGQPVFNGANEAMRGVGAIFAMTNTGAIIESHVDMLGTYLGTRSYQFSKNGMTAIDERYAFSNGVWEEERRGPVTKAEVPCRLEKNGVLEDATLPAGIRIYPANSDENTVVGFYLEDGTYGEILFERKDHTVMINGIEESELFDELPYAG